MSILKDAWSVFHESWKAQRDLERRKKQFNRLTTESLNYPMLEDLAKAAAKMQPGFYIRVPLQNGGYIEMGVKERDESNPRRSEAAMF